MGKHTAYWEEYARSQVRGTLRLFGAIFVWVLVVALLAVWHEAFGESFPWLLGIAFVGLVVAVTWLGTRAQKVACPECASTYTRTKWGGQCPACGLGLLQNDP
jgi:hypothetical protein